MNLKSPRYDAAAKLAEKRDRTVYESVNDDGTLILLHADSRSRVASWMTGSARIHLIAELSRAELEKLYGEVGAYLKKLRAAEAPKELAPNERGWFRIRITDYGSFPYWGTRKEAGERARSKADWEGGRAFVKRLHDDDPEVLKEIESMRKFYQARGLPTLDLSDSDSVREVDAYRKNLPEVAP